MRRKYTAQEGLLQGSAYDRRGLLSRIMLVTTKEFSRYCGDSQRTSVHRGGRGRACVTFVFCKS